MLRVIALLFTVAAATAIAEPPAIPVSVRSVASAGHWEVNGRAGTYRVVIVNEGWEHIWSRLFVEWLAVPASRSDELTIVSAVEPALPFPRGTMILDATLRARATGRLDVFVVGTPNGAGVSSKTMRLSLVAKAPGVVTVGAPHRTE